MHALLARLHTLTKGACGRRRSTAALCALAARLPTDTRRVVTLRKVYGWRPDAIAARLGLTPAQVEHHLITAALVFSGCIDLSESDADRAAGGEARPAVGARIAPGRVPDETPGQHIDSSELE